MKWLPLLLAAALAGAAEPDGTTRLHQAVYSGDHDETRRLLAGAWPG